MKTFKMIALGCLGLVVAVVLTVVTLAGVAWLQVRSPTVEQRVLSHEVSQLVAPPPVGAKDAPPASHVVLELSQAEFRIEPGHPGEPLRVEATYDTARYALEEQFETAADASFRYHVSFHRTGSWVMDTMRQLWGGPASNIRILLPPDVPLAIELDLAEGAATIEMGGLWLTEVDVTFQKGALELWASKPLAAPVERMAIHGSMGGMSISSLGNASPRELSIEFSMGGMELGLGGRWLVDSNIVVRTHMGGGSIRLPDNVVVRGLETGSITASPDADAPTLTFDVKATMGGLEVVDDETAGPVDTFRSPPPQEATEATEAR